jgi:hypothetical protein
MRIVVSQRDVMPDRRVRGERHSPDCAHFFDFGRCALGVVAYFTYQRKLRRAKAIERGLKMVPILIHLPPPASDTQGENRDVREVMREKTSAGGGAVQPDRRDRDRRF